MFYSFFNHLYNRQRDLGRDAWALRRGGSVGDFGDVLAQSWFYLVAPQIIDGLMAGGSSHDEDESWGKWAAKHIGLGLLSGIPVLRDAANHAAGHPYAMSSIARLVPKMGNLAKNAAHALGMIDGEPSDRWVQHAIETPGYMLGLPTGQAAGTGQFLWDVWHGQQDPHGLADWLHG